MPKKPTTEETPVVPETPVVETPPEAAPVSAAPAMPDFLARLLGESATVEDTFVEPESNDRVRLTRVDVPQKTSQDTSSIGKFVITPADADAELEQTETMRVILIDVLNFSTRNSPGSPRNVPGFILSDPDYSDGRSLRLPISGRTLWPYDKETGQRAVDATAPDCQSSNGITPWTSFIGKNVYDPRHEALIKIGTIYGKGADGEPVQSKSAYPCLTCPMGSWHRTAEGKNLPPICNPATRYVLYDIDRDQLFTMRGGNRGLQLALEGQTKKRDTDPAYWDGTEMKGIEHFYRPTDAAQAGVNLTQPEGFPTAKDWNRPVYPLLMTMAYNTFSPNPTLVPQFTVMDGKTPLVTTYGYDKLPAKPTTKDKMAKAVSVIAAPLSMEELGRFLQARLDYHEKDLRSKLMSLDEIQPSVVVSNDVVDAALSLEPGDASATPPWNDAIEVDDDEIEEASAAR